jgi:hypothetical protein
MPEGAWRESGLGDPWGAGIIAGAASRRRAGLSTPRRGRSELTRHAHGQPGVPTVAGSHLSAGWASLDTEPQRSCASSWRASSRSTGRPSRSRAGLPGPPADQSERLSRAALGHPSRHDRPGDPQGPRRLVLPEPARAPSVGRAGLLERRPGGVWWRGSEGEDHEQPTPRPATSDGREEDNQEGDERQVRRPPDRHRHLPERRERAPDHGHEGWREQRAGMRRLSVEAPLLLSLAPAPSNDRMLKLTGQGGSL